MNEADRIRLIMDLLKDDPFLSPIIGVAAPQGILMPFAGQEQKTYVMVGVFITEQNFNRDTLAAVCRRIVELLRPCKMLADLDGLEIMPSLVTSGRTERIFRLSILSSALPMAEQFAPADIERRKPADGITCILYKHIP